MEAPDKLYISIQDLGSGYAYDISLDDNGGQEYIRKDALMEWAKDFKRRTGWYEIEVAMDDLIDKLNSM